MVVYGKPVDKQEGEAKDSKHYVLEPLIMLFIKTRIYIGGVRRNKEKFYFWANHPLIFLRV